VRRRERGGRLAHGRKARRWRDARAARPLGSALSRTWWPVAIPLAIAVPRLRIPVAALMIARRCWTGPAAAPR